MIKPIDEFVNVTPASPEYPNGAYRNDTVTGDKTGTPLDAVTFNDMQGFSDALLAEAGIVPSGEPDTATSSQRLDAIKAITVKKVDTIADLQGLTGVEGQQVSVASYKTLNDKSGGGILEWTTTVRHDGGLFVDPNREPPTDWSNQTQVEEWFADSGVDVAGWARTDVEEINPKMFGADGYGVVDNIKIFNKVFSVGAGKTIRITKPSVKYVVSGRLNSIPSNTNVIFDKGALIESTNSSESILYSFNTEGISIKRPTLTYSTAGATGLIGAVHLSGCLNYDVSHGDIKRAQFSGIFIDNSDDGMVRSNKISETTGTHPDSNDICMYNSASYNLAEFNKCLGVGAHGILVQGPGATIPFKNKLVRNRITEKEAYGILVYQVTPSDTFTELTENDVDGIKGSALGGSSGMGLYIQSSGGCKLTRNNVTNCNRETTSETNLPAAISISFDTVLGPALATVTLTDNKVITSNYYAIAAANAKVIMKGNDAYSASLLNGGAILIQDCSNSIVSSNKASVPVASTRSIVKIAAVLASQFSNNCNNNDMSGGNGIGLQMYADSGLTLQVNASGNTVVTTGADSQGANFDNLINSTLTGNFFQGAAAGLIVSNLTGCRGTGNIIKTSTANRFLSSGTNLNNYFDESNDFDMTDTGKIQNTTAGVNICQRFNAPPSGGNWQVGDRVIQSSPAVGSPKGWMCTLAGSPGTWVSEGNL